MNLRFGVRDDTVSRARATRVADALRAALDAQAPTREGEVAVVPVTVGRGDDDAASDPELLSAALRVALVSGECDAIIQEAAELPLDESADLVIAAYLPAREARLALCTAGPAFGELEPAARIVVRDVRVAAQVARLREDLVVEVDPSDVAAVLARVAAGEVAAAILPLGDVDLAELDSPLVAPLPPDQVLPAAGQGIVAIEMRSDAAPEVAAILSALDDPDARTAVTAERAAMRALGAGPGDAVSAYATVAGEDMTLHVRVTSLSGGLVLNDESSGPASEPEFLGSNAGRIMIGRGAARLMRMP
jgi:hydroxymethylbilane synthase